MDNLKPIQIEAESEIVEATDTLNAFINKVKFSDGLFSSSNRTI